ncbi:hypothetical protein B0H11DRAFT_1929312 [Mycena galericulata]|nr:hypothetical protein B0H11DRAFT_1929312 [Mycena galericulata]
MYMWEAREDSRGNSKPRPTGQAGKFNVYSKVPVGCQRRKACHIQPSATPPLSRVSASIKPAQLQSQESFHILEVLHSRSRGPRPDENHGPRLSVRLLDRHLHAEVESALRIGTACGADLCSAHAVEHDGQVHPHSSALCRSSGPWEQEALTGHPFGASDSSWASSSNAITSIPPTEASANVNRRPDPRIRRARDQSLGRVAHIRTDSDLAGGLRAQQFLKVLIPKRLSVALSHLSRHCANLVEMHRVCPAPKEADSHSPSTIQTSEQCPPQENAADLFPGPYGRGNALKVALQTLSSVSDDTPDGTGPTALSTAIDPLLALVSSIEHHLDGMGATMSDTQTFQQDACAAVGSTRGEKTAWISHLIGGKHKEACPHASPEAKADAATLVNLWRA